LKPAGASQFLARSRSARTGSNVSASPKEKGPPAQRCRVAATLGSLGRHGRDPKGVEPVFVFHPNVGLRPTMGWRTQALRALKKNTSIRALQETEMRPPRGNAVTERKPLSESRLAERLPSSGGIWSRYSPWPDATRLKITTVDNFPCGSKLSYSAIRISQSEFPAFCEI
jgi:hypothetical protein